MKTFRRASVTAVVVLALSSCSAGGDQRIASPSDNHHVVPRLMVVDDPLANASLAELSKSSDAVLVGTVVSREDGIQFGTGEAAIPYTAFDIEVTEAISGDPAKRVRVLMITEDVRGNPVEIEGRPTFTGGDAIWILTEIDPQFDRPGDFVLTSVAGVLPVDNDRVNVEHSEAPAVSEAMELGTVQKIVEYLSSRG